MATVLICDLGLEAAAMCFVDDRLHQAWLVSRHECADVLESQNAASFTCY